MSLNEQRILNDISLKIQKEFDPFNCFRFTAENFSMIEIAAIKVQKEGENIEPR